LVAAAGKEQLSLTVLAGLSFVEPVLSALRLDGLDGLQLFDAIRVVPH